MAKIIPFRGTCYNKSLFKDISTLFAPPYDVVTSEERNGYTRRNSHNIFRLELPSRDDCQGEVQDKYDCASRLLKSWLAEKVLQKDQTPSVYPYDIEFEADGSRFIRKGFVCLLRADDWTMGTVLPHERTFEKVTEDRFSLRMATGAQFSQIFMLYRHHKELDELLGSAEREELFNVRDDRGCSHLLSRISGRHTIDRICSCLRDRPLYIADGHHRYTTAIKYGKEMTALRGQNPDAPYNYTMVYLVDVKDPGMIVLPTHRLVAIPEGMSCEDIRKRLSAFFHLEELDYSPEMKSLSSGAAFRQMRAESCSNRITLVSGREKRAFVLCPREEARAQLLEKVCHRELAGLDVVVLEELVFKQALGIEPERLEVGRDIIYTADSQQAFRSLKENQMLFFLHPTPVEHVLDVADAGLSMPHKSTYFYPKILTGLVLNVEE